jgi:PAS domain S-box-containing protein
VSSRQSGRSRNRAGAARDAAQPVLRESEDRYRVLFDQNPLPSWVFDLETMRFLAVNDAAVEVYGYSRDEFLAMTIADIRPPQEVPALREALARAAAGEPVRGIWRHRKRDGTEIEVEITSHRLTYAGSRAELVLARDVTEQRHAEQALRASEERFRLLVGSVRDYAIFMLDPHGVVANWNRGAQQIKGYTAEEIVGRHMSTFYPPAAVAAGEPEANLRAARQAGRFEEENWRVRKDGSRFWADVVITAVRDDQGTLLGYAKVTRDLTERKRNDELLQRHTAELEAANAELDAFAYSVSHDLRQPLRGLDGFSQALLEDYADKLDPQGRHYLQRVRLASQRMAQLIDDLLDLSRVTRSQVQLESVDLSALARAIAADLQKNEPDRQVEFTITPDLVVRADRGLMRVVLDNLMGNAWKFTGKRPSAHIELGVTTHDGRPAYFVRDDGAGFDMAYADKLFGAFQRLHGAAEFAGTGIGLATVHRVIQRHGGRVWAESEPDRGATFYFALS